MAKGQLRGNREQKKPKAKKPDVSPAGSAPASRSIVANINPPKKKS